MYVQFTLCVQGVEFRQEGLNFYNISKIYILNMKINGNQKIFFRDLKCLEYVSKYWYGVSLWNAEEKEIFTDRAKNE